MQEPETTFADDVKATTRALDALDGNSILVGHSYGGAVITEAGNHAKVAGLVYVSAFEPDVGESLKSLNLPDATITTAESVAAGPYRAPAAPLPAWRTQLSSMDIWVTSTASKAKELPTGGFMVLPAKQNHFLMTKSETVVEISSMGPFAITYVNPADDPRGPSTTTKK